MFTPVIIEPSPMPLFDSSELRPGDEIVIITSIEEN
jgi:hypothetical protein